MKKQTNYWPHSIVGSIFAVLGLIYWTIVSTMSAPLAMENLYHDNHHIVDKNINDIIFNDIAFKKLYDLELQNNHLQTNKPLNIKLVSKNNQPIKDAKIIVKLTRPDSLKSDIELTKFTKLSDELYQFNIGELTKEGRWNIYINAMVNDKVGYLSYRADTRENVKYTKPQVITY